MRMMVEALEAAKTRGAPLKQWEAVCIQNFWKAHYDHIHSHHKNEDAILVPFLQTRFKYPEKVGSDGRAVFIFVILSFFSRVFSSCLFLTDCSTQLITKSLKPSWNCSRPCAMA
jgi:hypothetical protein